MRRLIVPTLALLIAGIPAFAAEAGGGSAGGDGSSGTSGGSSSGGSSGSSTGTTGTQDDGTSTGGLSGTGTSAGSMQGNGSGGGGTTLGNTGAGGMSTPTNTVDPINGRAIDPNLRPVIVTLRDGSTLAVAVSSAESAAVLRADPDKYAPAVRSNMKFDRTRQSAAGGSSSGSQGSRSGNSGSGNVPNR